MMHGACARLRDIWKCRTNYIYSNSKATNNPTNNYALTQRVIYAARARLRDIWRCRTNIFIQQLKYQPQTIQNNTFH